MREDITLWPYVQHEGNWSIPDEVMVSIWIKMVKEKKAYKVFYDGSVGDLTEWMQFIKSKYIFPVFVVDKKKINILGGGWLTDFRDGTALIHFFTFGEYIENGGELVLGFFKKTFNEIKVFIGITPGIYKPVIKLIESWGFKTIGVIPQMCNMFYFGKRVNGAISYYLTGGEENGTK